jgi:hypothetical protein
LWGSNKENENIINILLVAIAAVFAMAVPTLKDTLLAKLELLSNATTIDSALSYIRNKQQQKELAIGHKDDRPMISGIQIVF